MKEGLLLTLQTSVDKKTHRASINYGYQTSKGENRPDRYKGRVAILFSYVSVQDVLEKAINWCADVKPNLPILNLSLVEREINNTHETEVSNA